MSRVDLELTDSVAIVTTVNPPADWLKFTWTILWFWLKA